ncbi:MAG TPA: hypothetical protein VF170_13710, partial [Planctomycetaceae bacterium]
MKRLPVVRISASQSRLLERSAGVSGRYWLHARFGLDPAALGGVFLVSNLLAAGSVLLAARLARRFGLIETMVFTHLPSNGLLVLVPFMPTAES